MTPETEEFTRRHLETLAADLKKTILANRAKQIGLLKNKQPVLDFLTEGIESEIEESIFGQPMTFGEEMVKKGLLDGIATPEQM